MLRKWRTGRAALGVTALAGWLAMSIGAAQEPPGGPAGDAGAKAGASADAKADVSGQSQSQESGAAKSQGSGQADADPDAEAAGQAQTQSDAPSDAPQPTPDPNEPAAGERDAQDRARQDARARDDDRSRGSRSPSDIFAERREWWQDRNAGLGVKFTGCGCRVYAEAIYQGSPAHRAGLRAGDRVVSFNGRRLRSTRHAVAIVSNMSPRDDLRIGVVRDGRYRQIDTRLAAPDQAFAQGMLRSETAPQFAGRETEQQRYRVMRPPLDSETTGMSVSQMEQKLDSLQREVDRLRRQVQRLDSGQAEQPDQDLRQATPQGTRDAETDKDDPARKLPDIPTPQS